MSIDLKQESRTSCDSPVVVIDEEVDGQSVPDDTADFLQGHLQSAIAYRTQYHQRVPLGRLSGRIIPTDEDDSARRIPSVIRGLSSSQLP